MSTLLGENVVKQEADELKAICEKLEVINLQLARRKIARRAALHWLFIALCAAIIIIYHVFEWLFVRFAPIAFVGSLAGAFMTRKK